MLGMPKENLIFVIYLGVALGIIYSLWWLGKTLIQAGNEEDEE